MPMDIEPVPGLVAACREWPIYIARRNEMRVRISGQLHDIFSYAGGLAVFASIMTRGNDTAALNILSVLLDFRRIAEPAGRSARLIVEVLFRDRGGDRLLRWRLRGMHFVSAAPARKCLHEERIISRDGTRKRLIKSVI